MILNLTGAMKRFELRNEVGLSDKKEVLKQGCQTGGSPAKCYPQRNIFRAIINSFKAISGDLFVTVSSIPTENDNIFLRVGRTRGNPLLRTPPDENKYFRKKFLQLIIERKMQENPH